MLEPRPNTAPHSTTGHLMLSWGAWEGSASDGYRYVFVLNVFMNGSAGLDNFRESRRLLHRVADEAERAICRVYSVDLRHCLQDVRAYRRGYSKQRLSLRSRRHRIRKRLGRIRCLQDRAGKPKEVGPISRFPIFCRMR